MGWIALALLAAAAFGALVLLGIPRLLWSMLGAALMLGATGYALQGRPGLPASAPRPVNDGAGDAPDVIALRDAMFGRFSGDAAYLTAADAMMRAGERRAAVRVVLGGISAIPESVMLWTALGNAYSAHDGGQMSPPALFAYQQALRLSPRHPGPPFFMGMAYVRAQDFAAARRCWTRALSLTPADASYRKDIALRLALLDRLLAMQDRGN